jgi:hypothetical protein
MSMMEHALTFDTAWFYSNISVSKPKLSIVIIPKYKNSSFLWNSFKIHIKKQLQRSNGRTHAINKLGKSFILVHSTVVKYISTILWPMHSQWEYGYKYVDYKLLSGWGWAERIHCIHIHYDAVIYLLNSIFWKQEIRYQNVLSKMWRGKL